mgnify:CR=1 FL=1
MIKITLSIKHHLSAIIAFPAIVIVVIACSNSESDINLKSTPNTNDNDPKSANTIISITPTPIPDLLFLYSDAIAYLEMEEYKDSITRFTQIINITPNLAIAYKGRGSAYYYEGLLDLAISDLEKSIALDSDLGGNYMYLGMIYKDTGDINNAEKSVTKAISLIHPIREQKEFLKATKQLEYIQSLQANP